MVEEAASTSPAAAEVFRFSQPTAEDASLTRGPLLRPAATAAREDGSTLDQTFAATVDASSGIDSHCTPEVIAAREIVLAEKARPSRSLSSGEECKSSSGDVRLELPGSLGETKLDGTRQSIFLVEDDIQLELGFLFRSTLRRIVWWFVCLLSVGIVYLVAFYSPRFWIWANGTKTALPAGVKRGKTWVSIKTRYEPVALVELSVRELPKPVTSDWLYPPSMRLPPASAASFAAGEERNLCRNGASAEPITSVSLVNYRSMSLLLTPVGFVPLSSWRDAAWTDRAAVQDGLSESDAELRRSIFGANVVDIDIPGWGKITVQEALHPFYIFSLCSIALWSYDEYQWYALVIGIVSLIGIAASVISTRRALVRLQGMSRFVCDIRMLRSRTNAAGENGPLAQWQVVKSNELVPGDIVDLAASGAGKLDVLPCDCVLLESDAITSEAMLTGESVPVVKVACPSASLGSVLAAGEPLTRLDKHALYGGTSLIRSRPGQDGETSRALVVSTAFNTAKGSLIRTMLFPRPFKMDFYSDGYLFISILACIALITFFGILVNFIQIGVDDTEIALRSLDLFTICVPPALPAAMSVCTTLAIRRLRKAQIYCTSPRRINVAGKISIACFDKTGTLTEAQLDVMGIRNARRNSSSDGKLSALCSSMDELNADASELQGGPTLAEALATSHDLNMLNAGIIGEPLEAAMFAWSGASLDEEAACVQLSREGADQGQALDQDGVAARVTIVRLPSGEKRALIKKYSFESGLRRATVISKAEGQVGARVYCKGAPEALAPLCDPASLPNDYDEVLNRFTHQCYRVLALAGKELSGLSWNAAQAMPRSSAESDLVMLGLLVFENKLKLGSKATIAKLHRANIPTKMVTGDAPLTAIAVARNCGMIRSDVPVFMARISDADVKAKGESNAGTLEWVDVNSDKSMLDPYSLKPSSGSRLADVALVLTGETFSHLLQHGAIETVDRALVHAAIFARMSPEQKQELVEQLQDLEHTTAFVGDGANDCGALKASAVGLSLSEAEASVAAPFTSREDDIDCIDHLIREGRNSLTTSINLFSWMVIYSLAEFWSVTLLYLKTTSFDNAEYLYLDCFMVIPIAIGMANNTPASVLARRPPPSRLMSRRVVLSVLSQMALLMLASMTAFLLLHRQSWYIAPELVPDDLQLSSQDNTVLFKQSVFTLSIAAILWSYGPPHRQPIYKNWLLCTALVALTAVNFAILAVNSPNPFFNLFGFWELEQSFLGVIVGIVFVQATLALLMELFVIDRLAALLERPVRSLQQAWRVRRARRKGLSQDSIRGAHKRWRVVTSAIASGA